MKCINISNREISDSAPTFIIAELSANHNQQFEVALETIKAAKAAGVQTFVALSTDKAVKPVNAMGVSKAMMEKIVCSQNQFENKTTFCCVRYGNVMGSRGSVIPLFKEQIDDGASNHMVDILVCLTIGLSISIGHIEDLGDVVSR